MYKIVSQFIHRDVWEAVPYGYITNVTFTIVGDGFLHVPLTKIALQFCVDTE
jgi:hypothetical protein